MSSSLHHNSVRENDRWRSLWLASVCVLPVIELIALTLRHDSAVLSADEELWARWLGNAPILSQTLISIVAVLVILGGRRLRELTAELSDASIEFQSIDT